MTLTSPACPVAESLPGEVRQRIKDMEETKDVNVELVWEPPWNKEMMTDEAKLNLGFL
jgi:metal-sulfur cluster biosynthetic enzyme